MKNALAVDAPRSVPNWQEENYAYRSCEKAAKAIDPGAGTFSGAAALYLRWFEIKPKLPRDCRVIETYPRVVWKRLNLPGTPKQLSLYRPQVQAKLSKLVQSPCDGFSSHQIDAVLCAYVAFCYAAGRAEALGTRGEGLIFVPAIDQMKRLPEDEDIKPCFRRFKPMGP